MPTLPYINLGAAPLPLGPEYDRLELDFLKRRAVVADSVTPANNFNGAPEGLLSVARASGGGVFDADRKYVWGSASNTLRYDHDPVTGAARGILIEEQRTNLFTYSADFSNAVWAKTRSAVVADSAMAPDGTMSADLLREDTTASATHLMTRSMTVSASTAYAFSFFLKPAGRTEVAIQENIGGTAAIFDLTGGTASVVSGSATIQAVGEGWFRCTIAGVTGAGQTSLIAGIYLRAGGSSSYTGDGDSGVYVWGAQLEAGGFPTSYIPTAAAQVTRASENISINPAAFPYSNAEGTFVFDLERHAVLTSDSTYIVSRTAAGRFLYSTGADPLTSRAYDGTTILTGISTPLGSRFRWAIGWAGAQMRRAQTGSPGVASAAYDGAWGTGNITLGSNVGVSNGITRFRGLKFVPRLLSDPELLAAVAL